MNSTRAFPVRDTDRFRAASGLTRTALLLIALILGMGPAACAQERPPGEIKDYQGRRLDAFDRAYDNSLKGPQKVDIAAYRLEITGLVEKPLALSYAQVLALPQSKRALTLNCVEGWQERLLFEGVRLSSLIALAKPKPGVTTVIFHAVDGDSSSLDYAFVTAKDILLAFRINGRDLDAKRGFPFQVAAESKLGYKWVKWVQKIELSTKPYQGYWEQRGYSNSADVK